MAIDLSRISSITIGKPKKKEVYPTKHTMNLHFRQDKTTRPATLALYTLFALVVVLGLGKFMFFDIWWGAQEAHQQVIDTENKIAALAADAQKYDEVKLEYMRYADTDEEAKLIERLQVLSLIEANVTKASQVNSIAISGTTISLRISGVTLAQVSNIVSALESSNMVAGTEVNTASTQGQGGREQVIANFKIALVDPSQVASEKASSSNTSDTGATQAQEVEKVEEML